MMTMNLKDQLNQDQMVTMRKDRGVAEGDRVVTAQEEKVTLVQDRMIQIQIVTEVMVVPDQIVTELMVVLDQMAKEIKDRKEAKVAQAQYQVVATKDQKQTRRNLLDQAWMKTVISMSMSLCF